MRKIIETTLVSLDGVIGDPHVWASEYLDNEARRRPLERLEASDGMLVGRRTYQMFSGMWPHASGPYPERINSTPKYVFSSTLKRAEWSNTTIVRGDVAADAAKLKEQAGRDLVIYGHGQLAQRRGPKLHGLPLDGGAEAVPGRSALGDDRLGTNRGVSSVLDATAPR